MGSISVSSDFNKLCNNLKISDSVVDTIRNRYHSITKRINVDFWDSNSETSHSLYVGSYGRGTCIYTSDIDIIVELPWSIKARFDNYSGNKQSALLQCVRDSLKCTYSSSSISADGQVVDIVFSDGVKFEVVPAFKYTDDTGYVYGDTNNGGSWKSMDPKAELDAFRVLNQKTNGNLKRFCQMIRAWNENKTVLMSGILIDTTVYKFLSNYSNSDKSYSYYDWFSRDYFKYLYDNGDQDYWYKPGSDERVYKSYTFKTDAKQAYEKCLEALEDYSKDYSYSWHKDWREIYGSKFPES